MASLGPDFTVNWHNGPSWNAVKSCQFVKHISGEGCSSVDPTLDALGGMTPLSTQRRNFALLMIFVAISHFSSRKNWKWLWRMMQAIGCLNPAGQQIVLEIDEVRVL